MVNSVHFLYWTTMLGKNVTPGRSMGLDAWMLFAQSRCANEPLYMFICIALLLAVDHFRDIKILT